MTRMCGRPKSLAARSCILALCLVIGLNPAAWAVDMTQWNTYFNGVSTGMGPYAWVDGPEYLKNDAALANGVFAGQEGTIKMYVCRSKGSDGTHLGKFFNQQCNIGWGGREYAVTSGYELLVNTQPTNAKYFPQKWVVPNSHEGNQYGFYGGAAGGQNMRPCRASYMGGTHAGKEWAWRCNIGYGGQEVVIPTYEVLNLMFDKQAWQAAGSPNPTTQGTLVTSGATWTQGATVVFPTLNLTLNATPIQIPVTNIDTTDYVAKMLNDFSAAYAAGMKTSWTPGYLGTGLNKFASTLPGLTYSLIDKYNADQTDAALRIDRTAFYNGVLEGNVEAQALMGPLMVKKAKAVLDSGQAWTVDETGLIHFLQALAMEQRIKAAGQAKTAFEAWKVSDRENKTVGLLALTYTPSKPPPEFLAMAQGGYAITPALAYNFGRLLATTAGMLTAAGAALGTGLTAAGASAMTAASISVSANAALAAKGIGAAWGLGGATIGFAAVVAVVVLMVTAGIVKGVGMAEYDQYVKDMDAAIKDAQNPVSADQLRSILSSSEGITRAIYWVMAQSATGTK